jgi:hypothetical protein
VFWRCEIGAAALNNNRRGLRKTGTASLLAGHRKTHGIVDVVQAPTVGDLGQALPARPKVVAQKS